MWQYNKRSLLNVLFIISLSLSFGIPRALAQTTSAEEYDIVLLGGRVIDPETGFSDDIRNIGIKDSKIRHSYGRIYHWRTEGKCEGG